MEAFVEFPRSNTAGSQLVNKRHIKSLLNILDLKTESNKSFQLYIYVALCFQRSYRKQSFDSLFFVFESPRLGKLRSVWSQQAKD
jgi:hypothetical protein